MILGAGAAGTMVAAKLGPRLAEDEWKITMIDREQGETPTLRRVSSVGEVPTKRLFHLFPKKPARKMAYVAGLPKPAGCVQEEPT